jgi:hypothetical protein
VRAVTFGTEKLGLHAAVGLTDQVLAILPLTETGGSRIETATAGTGLGSTARSTPAAIVGAVVAALSAGRSGSGSGQTAGTLMVAASVSRGGRARVRSGRSGRSGLVAHVRGNIGGTSGVEAHASWVVSDCLYCLVPRLAETLGNFGRGRLP